MKPVSHAWLVAVALVLIPTSARANQSQGSPQSGDLVAATSDRPVVVHMTSAILDRLDQIEAQNAALRSEVDTLRRELEQLKGSGIAAKGTSSTVDRLDELGERLDLHEVRISEQGQVKAESSQRVPVQLSGMILFNLFGNSRHGVPAAVEYPTTARIESAPASFGASLRRSVFGAEFQTPQAVLGGRFRGSFFLDLAGGAGGLTDTQPRLRTADIEGRWNRWAIFAGQEKPIFSPREPSSLAQVHSSPLAGAGNFWLWRPQLRVERLVSVTPATEFRARIGVSQTPETVGIIPPEIRASVEARRAALEGHFQIAREFSADRRIEIGSGFHRSTSHFGAFSAPADLVSLDWFVKPSRWGEFTGVIFTGQNMSKGGAGGTQGVALVPLGLGQFEVVPVGRRGGWAQLTLLPTSRWSINLQAGLDDLEDDYLIPTSISRNQAFVFNTFYRLAPNVIWGVEVAQLRTRFKAGQRPRALHHDLYFAYLF